MTDTIDHPQHYSRWKMEPVEFIALNNLPWWMANIIKYIMREDAKDGLQDLYKARSYLEMKIRQLEGIVRFWEKPVQEQRSLSKTRVQTTPGTVDYEYSPGDPGGFKRVTQPEGHRFGGPDAYAAALHEAGLKEQPEWLKQTQAYGEKVAEAKAWHERITATVPQAFCRCGVNVTSKGFACWDDDCVHKQSGGDKASAWVAEWVAAGSK